MARILAISSQVARGNVGLSIIVPALQAFGHDVMALPTVVLSNHPGHPHVAGTRIDPPVLRAMLDALEANGWLAGIDAILTGYLPGVEHVLFAAEAVGRIRAVNGEQTAYLCDPVLGDDPKGLYIDEAAAGAIRATLLPLADIATPNRFELSFLSRRPVHDARDAMAIGLGRCAFIATSIPSQHPGETLNVSGGKGPISGRSPQRLTRVALRDGAPHGTGDLFSALVLAAKWALDGSGVCGTLDALAFATAGVDATLAASAGHDHLRVSALPSPARPVMPWPVETP